MRSHLKTKLLVAAYLVAIIAANNIVTYMGPRGLLITALFLIPFDLIARDQLQDNWRGNWMLAKMGLLICSGSLIAYFFNSDTKAVSTASAASFLVAGSIDCLLYTLLEGRKKFIKMNLSNVGSSICDSILFQLVAFGSISYSIAASQSALKLLGGLFWSWIFVSNIEEISAAQISL